MIFVAGAKGEIMSKEYKKHIEREEAKAQLRIWLSDCVLDGAKMDKEETDERI